MNSRDATLEEHWQFGYQDAARTLSHPEVTERTTQPDGVRTFDYVSTDWGPMRHRRPVTPGYESGVVF